MGLASLQAGAQEVKKRRVSSEETQRILQKEKILRGNSLNSSNLGAALQYNIFGLIVITDALKYMKNMHINTLHREPRQITNCN